MRACLCVCEWVSACVCVSLCVCVALHNFHANAASDDLPQSSFASCTPLPASLSSSLSLLLFLFSALFTSTRSLSLSYSCAFSFEPHFDCFSLSACFSCGSKLCHLCLERLLKWNVCCASSTTSFSSPPSLPLPFLGDVFGWMLLLAVGYASHRTASVRRVDLCSIV